MARRRRLLLPHLRWAWLIARQEVRLWCKHAFSRYKFRGALVTWCLNYPQGWLRVHRLLIRWHFVERAPVVEEV